MEPSKSDALTKIHFLDSSGSNVGAVFADRVLRHQGEIKFYFGSVCVAILGEQSLKLGSRQLKGSFRTVESLFLHNDPDRNGREGG